MRKSIKNRINYLLAVSLLVLSFFMIGVNLVIIYRATANNSEIMMSKTCEAQAQKLNTQISLVEQSVNNLYEISERMRPKADKLKDTKLVDEFLNNYFDTAIAIAQNTKGALAIYYRMNPELTGNGVTGFFSVRSSDTDKFEASETTDLNIYDVNDVEHVGWYYIPVWAGRAVWMEPYYNANIDVKMISYVVPIYDGNLLVGVVGIDVDFNALIDIAEDIDIYKSCGGVLCSMSNSEIYYNHCDLLGSSIPSDIYNILQGADTSDDVLTYKVKGEQYGMYYRTLDNRMKLLIYANMNEIYKQGSSFLITSLIVLLVVFGGTLLVSLYMGEKIVKPIIDITEASKKYADGDWDAKVECNSGDELQLLTENISIMADKTKNYIKYINDMAKKDGLTGLRNKTDYLMYVEKINQEYLPSQKEFAVAVFDVNNLKKVNDNYGHEKGDELLLSASKCICRYFAHSPVFRVGGDEFVAVLDGADYANRDEIVQEMQKHMKLAANSEDIMTVCVAVGLSACPEDGTVYEELFDMADQRMYDNKIELKNGVEPR